MREKSRNGASAKRLNLGLSARDVERLAKLSENTNASSDTEVIKRALLTYEALVERLIDGSVFFVRDKGDNGPVPFNFLIDIERQPIQRTNVVASIGSVMPEAPAAVHDVGLAKAGQST